MGTKQKFLGTNLESSNLPALTLEQQHSAFSDDRAHVIQTGSLKKRVQLLVRPFSASGRHYQHLEIRHKRLDADVNVAAFGDTAFNDYQFCPAGHLFSAGIENCHRTIIVPIV